MAPGPSQTERVNRDRAFDLMMSEHGEAVVLITEGDASMLPHLAGGDAVLAVPIAGPPRAGDLLLYEQSDYWVVHRCLGAATTKDGRRGYRTRGDGRNVLDPLLTADRVRARIVAVRRAGAWRSLDGTLARGYARLIAAHDLFWAAGGIVARTIGLGGLVASIDSGLLRLLVPPVFPAVHRRMADKGRLIE